MASEGFVFHSSPTYTNDPLNSSPKEYMSGEIPMLWNVNGISSGYGPITTPGTYPHPSTCQLDLFDQATTGSFPIYCGESAKIMQDERSAFQNSYVAAQSFSQSLGDDINELPPVSSSYPPLLSSLCSSKDSNPFGLQDWSAFVDGGSGDTSFSSVVIGSLYDSNGPQNPPIPGSHSMDTTNGAQNGFCFPIDFLTFVPGQSNIPDAENQNAFHAVAGSVPQLEFTDVASGIQTLQPSSVSTPVTEAMDAADGLIKPCPNRYRKVPVQDWAVNLGVSPHLCFYYLRDCLPNTQYQCSVDRCTDTFTETEIGNHFKAKHYGIARNPQRVTCKECGRTVRAKSYHDHFLQIHSGRSICCAYCTKRQVRVQNFPRHFKTCPGLKKYRKGQKALRPTYDFKSYLPPSSSPLPSVSNPYPSDVQERSTSNDGGRDDTSLSSSTPCELDDAMGTEKPSVRARDLMEATNWAHDLYSRTNHILDGDNANASHTHLGSISPPDDASPLAFGTISSRHPSVTEKLLKPCPDGYREVRDDSIQTWKGRPLPGLLVYYLRDPPAIPHSCPVDGCTSQFFGDGIRAHLKAVHRGITSQLYLKCRECDPKVSCIVAKNYATHFLDRHSGHSILCAYCLTSQSRAKNLPRHLVNHCSGLSYPKKRRAAA